MFGQQNNTTDQNDAAIPQQSIEGVLSDQPVPPGQGTMAPAATASSWQHPGMPIGQADVPADTTATPPINDITPPISASSPTVSSPSYAPDATSGADDLIDIKQKALSQLSPLVDHLDQTPEDKFRTTMMLIQASDNQALIKDAFAAAQAIPDEKSRAQALLDIVNEINYFTQEHDQ